ncbi:MAG TPA: hypothetical protein VEJ63_02040 [Planctomycetota bacterium]|nr:hypothetical protein [Planctomycetota bacterium]
MLRGFDDPDELTRITLKPGRWLALNLFCKLGHAKQDFTALCHPDSVTSKWDEGVGLITDSGLVGLFPPEALAAYDKLYNSLGDDFHNRICHFGVYTTDHMYPDAHLKLVASLQDSGMNGLNSLPNGTCIITGCPQSGKLRVGRDAAGEPSCILLDWR